MMFWLQVCPRIVGAEVSLTKDTYHGVSGLMFILFPQGEGT